MNDQNTTVETEESSFDAEQVKKEIQELTDSGKNRGQVFGYLQYMYELSNKDARLLMEQVLGKRSSSGTGWEDVVRFLRTGNIDSMDRKDIIVKMAEIRDGTESSANHALSYLSMAKEYSRQELEEFKKVHNIVDEEETEVSES